MYFKYGSFQHPDNLVNLVTMTKRTLYNARGLAYLERQTMRISVLLLPTSATQALIEAKIVELENAYASDGKDAGLFQDDDTKTSHFLDSSKAIGGVRVIDLTYPKSDGAEFATQREASITLEADFPITSDGLQSFQETLRFIGTGGPRVILRELLNGPPQPQVVNQRTVRRAVQSGSAIGFLAYPSFPGPIFPSAEHVDRREQQSAGARRDGNTFVDFPINWTYHFSSTGSLGGTPNRK